MQATDFVESYFDAWNHCDPKGVADHLTSNGIYCDIPEHVQRSHDELIASLSVFFSSDQHRYELVGDVMTSKDSIAFQYTARPTGTIKSRETLGPYNGAEFMILNGDAAITITDYYDVPDMPPQSQLARLTSREVRKHKYAKSGLDSEQLLDYKDRLQVVMQSQQAYLRSDLTLPKLADLVNCSVNHLSQVINAGFGMSFFDYLNRHRIEYARQLLTALNGQGNAILNIAFTVGFNSNSAFYAAFKKCVGQTPAQYRKSQLKKPH